MKNSQELRFLGYGGEGDPQLKRVGKRSEKHHYGNSQQGYPKLH
jgi:hypothetical protein